MPRQSVIRRGLRRWANHERDEAHELRRTNQEQGITSIADSPDREPVTVQGTVRTVTLRPRGGAPALEAELYDGSGVLTLTWLGRRRITGVSPGRWIKVRGRIGRQQRMRVMFNPRYELRP